MKFSDNVERTAFTPVHVIRKPEHTKQYNGPLYGLKKAHFTRAGYNLYCIPAGDVDMHESIVTPNGQFSATRTQ